MQLESSGWGGEGTFTPVLIDALKAVEAIELLRVEDAPASRAGRLEESKTPVQTVRADFRHTAYRWSS